MNAYESPTLILSWLWETTWQASLITVGVFALTQLFRRWLSPHSRQMLWLLIFVRLAMPALPTSPFSLIHAPELSIAEIPMTLNVVHTSVLLVQDAASVP